MSMTSLSGKVALVTGASSGIGRATALVLARAGVRLALVARRSDLLNTVASEIVAAGGDADVFVADVADEAQARAAVAAAEARFGAVDILVNNAGIIRPGAIASAATRDWRDTLNINLLAPMYLCQAVLSGMRSRAAGHVVMISSNAAKIPGAANNAVYSASKYGITALAAALRKEVANDGIRVTVIEPGTAASDIASSIPDEAIRANLDDHMRREGVMQAEDVASAILYAVAQPARVNIDEIWLTPTR